MVFVYDGTLELKRKKEQENTWAENGLPKDSMDISGSRRYGPVSERFFCMPYPFPFSELESKRRDQKKIFLRLLLFWDVFPQEEARSI
jgi:hypothetical protein